MEYALKASEMKACDQNTVTRIGIPSLVLMERAALAARRQKGLYRERDGSW